MIVLQSMNTINVFLCGCFSTAIAGCALVSLTGAVNSKPHFDEITVGRINIEEPDGTKRLIISNRTQFPGFYDRGKDIARPDRRDVAGMLFINDEGTENGGLIQKGSIVDGKLRAGVSLTFDRFRQDQALQLLHEERDKSATTSFVINYIPNHEATTKEKYGRIFLGTSRDKASALVLQDAKGKPRMMLMVSADGAPVIQMLDEGGRVVKSIAP